MKIHGLYRAYLFLLLTSFGAYAVIKDVSQYQLLDKVCVLVEGEDPILLSGIKKREEQQGINFALAEKELIQERLLWVYAKKQLKYDIASLFKAADDHLNKVMADNHLTREKFEKVLQEAPYSTTFRQFRLETATEFLKNNVKQTLASQIAITDEQLKAEEEKKFAVVFITVLPKKTALDPKKQISKAHALRLEFAKANAIRGKIRPTTDLNDIKTLYGSEKNISIVGPIAYQKGVLKKEAYDERLKSDLLETVIGPFEDDGAVTLIWKIKKSKKNLDETALEKLRKESYHSAVLEKFNALTDALINNSTVIKKGCGKP